MEITEPGDAGVDEVIEVSAETLAEERSNDITATKTSLPQITSMTDHEDANLLSLSVMDCRGRYSIAALLLQFSQARLSSAATLSVARFTNGGPHSLMTHLPPLQRDGFLPVMTI